MPRHAQASYRQGRESDFTLRCVQLHHRDAAARSCTTLADIISRVLAGINPCKLCLAVASRAVHGESQTAKNILVLVCVSSNCAVFRRVNSSHAAHRHARSEAAGRGKGEGR
ncbi:hypothetical protein TRVL_00916 [Trypanosoma vivax]|nr:hypothetical protein TRVL_00916 [Trypanosoma vivax]